MGICCSNNPDECLLRSAQTYDDVSDFVVRQWRPHIRDAIRDLVPRVPLYPAGHYILMSDLHLGNGDPRSDMCLQSKPALLRVLREAYRDPTAPTLVLLGDIEELWDYDPEQVLRAHPDIFDWFRLFHGAGRLIKIFGNHDGRWADPREVARYLHPTFPALTVFEGIRIDGMGLLIHGHNGIYDPTSCTTRLGSWCIRNVKGPLVLRMKGTSPSYQNPSTNRAQRDALEIIINDIGKELQIPILYGHTHKERLDVAYPWAINTGCGIFRNGTITYITLTPGGDRLLWTGNHETSIVTQQIASSLPLPEIVVPPL